MAGVCGSPTLLGSGRMWLSATQGRLAGELSSSRGTYATKAEIHPHAAHPLRRLTPFDERTR